MAYFRSWSNKEIFTSLYSQSFTATAANGYVNDITTIPTLLYFALFTHQGVGSGAVVEIWDNTTAGTKQVHLESASGDRAPFGLSIYKPILCSGGLTIAMTATAGNISFGYYSYAA